MYCAMSSGLAITKSILRRDKREISSSHSSLNGSAVATVKVVGVSAIGKMLKRAA